MAKLKADIRSLCRSHTAMGVRVLAQIATDLDQPAGARVNAVGLLFERGWGKSDVVHTGIDGGPIQVIIRQLIDVVQHSNGEDAKVIDHCDK